jgi:hypothetical protein
MRTPPTDIGGGKVLRFAVIDDDVRPTGATQHSYGQVIEGELVSGPPMEPFEALAIVQYENESDHYLLYLDADWEPVTDTWHESLEHAMDQAEYEYEGITPKWI